MSKKKCCCDDKETRTLLDEWCNHEHYSISWFNENIRWSREGVGFNPTYYGGGVDQCKQPNWKAAGTLTTELPSIGHPMAGYICDPNGCERIPNAEAGLYSERDPETGIDIQNIPSFRTSSTGLNNKAFGWGPATRYGDISPCWFNGINMTNIEDENESFFDITFKLKIEKQVGSGFSEIINTSVSGPARNLRPHPDAIRSYNVKNDPGRWNLLSRCPVFFNDFEDGEPVPCYQDFARMPRGPWPYRFKRKLEVDRNNLEECYVKDENGQPTRAYTLQEALNLGLTQCIIEGRCSPFGGDVGCCRASYLENNQFCNQLDPEKGTPYGWEDCPSACRGYSNHFTSGNTANLKFFGWLEPSNRYTTPEWDVEDMSTSETKKVSLHVIVPSQLAPNDISQQPYFCDVDNTEGRSFGEWCFGMDCEAKNGEIEDLENAGYVWSDGREADGIWLHKTPTNALRLLFTLDHSDIDQGQVWRVFKDWNVKVTNYVKTFNKGKENETSFRITLEQKVEEKYLSSLGCDCPSGYRVTDDGSLERVTPAGCQDRVPEPDPYTLGECEEGLATGTDMHCMNSLQGTKISFSERGPLVLNMHVEADNFGCIVCDPTKIPVVCDEKPGGTTRGTGNDSSQEGFKMIVNSGPNNANLLHLETEFFPGSERNGFNFAGHGGGADGCFCEINRAVFGLEPDWAYPAPFENRTAESIPASTYQVYYEHGARYMGALADIPFPGGHWGSPIGGKRYRNNYSGIKMFDLQDTYNPRFGPWARFGFYPHLYGDSYCDWTSKYCSPPDEYLWTFAVNEYPSFNVMDWPTRAPKKNCEVLCGPGACLLPPAGCDQCSDPPEGGGEPCICLCCPCEEIGGPENCPEVPEECRKTCGTQEGSNRSVCCNDLPEPCCICDCDDSPRQGCDIPPDANPRAIGPYRHPYWKCGENVGRKEGRGVDDPYWTCHPKWQDGDISPTGSWNPDLTWFWGMDSERIYFWPNGSSATVAVDGNVSCWDAYSCGNKTDDCTWIYCPCDNCSLRSREWKFCYDGSTSFGFGPNRFMFINWRKFLCQKRLRGGWRPALNEIQQLKMVCSLKAGDCEGSTLNPDNSDLDACNFMWTFEYTFNTDNTSFKRYACDGDNSEKTFTVTLEKHEIPTSGKFNQAWRPWDTKYKPNPGRSQLREHIIITAKGIDG